MNAHNQYPTQHEADNPKKGKVGRALGSLIGKGMAPAAEQKRVQEAVGSREYLDNLKGFMAAAEQKRGVVTADKRYESRLSTGSPITSREIQGGGRMDLTHLIVAGDSVFGVVTKSEKGSDGYLSLKSASVVALPYGPNERHDGGSKRYAPSATLMEFDVAGLRGRRVDGAVQEWQRERLGRTNPALAGDEALSRNHLDLTVTANGDMEIDDLDSTNGTYVLDGMSVGTMMGLQGEGGEHAMRMVSELAENQFMWDPSLSGQRVVPQQ